VRAWRVIRWCGLAVVLVSFVSAVVAGRRLRPPGPVRPNVLLVSIDSLRADHVGSYGYARDTSPAIDALAREGVLFENAISSAPWTVPAHMTLLTGLPPEVHDVVSVRQKLSPDAVTLAEVLQGAGYATAAFVSGPTVMAHHGFDQGFASYDESMVERRPGRAGSAVSSPGLVALVDRWLERWDRTEPRAPFFVFLHMWDVHYDYVPPPEYVQRFDPGYDGDLDARHLETNERIRRGMSPRDLQHLIALYDGEIRFTDDHLARVFAKLRALDVLDDTIVVVTSDHGEEFFEHGAKGHAKTLYDEVLHVPLVVRYPRRVAPMQRVSQQVRLMDVAPTILGLAGVPAGDGFGASDLAPEHRFADLAPYLSGHGPSSFPVLPAFSSTRWLSGNQSAVRTPQAKLIRYEPPLPNRAGTEVFDLVLDPGEQVNLLPTETAPVLLATLDPLLVAWRADAGRQTRLALLRRPDAQAEARLKALGYVQ
jgi:arylsulfatase A-like enzyme